MGWSSLILVVAAITVGGGLVIWLTARRAARKCAQCGRFLLPGAKTCPFCGSAADSRQTFFQPFQTARLVCVAGPRRGQQFVLRGRQVDVGRSPESDLRLDDDLVSWRHALLASNDGQYALYDQDSTNGTWVNGQRIAQCAIRPGIDQIQIGPSLFIVQVADQPIPDPLPVTPLRAAVAPAIDFGDYEPIATLGGGGIATVYKAISKRDGQVVALKALQHADPYLRDKFRKEGQEIGRLLHHPHIVRVYGGGENDGLLYLVMEFMDGGTLRDRLHPGRPLAMDQVVAIGGQVCDALHYAHQMGVVHRDIKPENIFFSASGQVKLGDFGIARLARSATRTVSGWLIGTPAYMSYEQAKGLEIDGRSDLYSLGIVLYEMVAGRCPFAGDGPLAVLEKHVQESPIPPSRVNPAVPPAIESAIARALSKDRDRRFQTAEEMARALGYDGPLQPGERLPEPIEEAGDTQQPERAPAPRGRRAPRLVRPDGTAIPLASRERTLNRHDVDPDDLEISRLHAHVVRRGGTYWIEDVGSVNGTFVNGVRIFHPQVLQLGDEIRLGRMTLRVEE